MFGQEIIEDSGSIVYMPFFRIMKVINTMNFVTIL